MHLLLYLIFFFFFLVIYFLLSVSFILPLILNKHIEEISAHRRGAKMSSRGWSHSAEPEPSADEKRAVRLIRQITADYNAPGTAEWEIIAERWGGE